MTPYEFKPNSGQLVQQPDGQWVAGFEAAIYSHQSFSQFSNSLTPQNVRLIEFNVLGDEDGSINYHAGNSTPYARGSETDVQLVLYKDGKRKGSITMGYP